MSFLEFYNLILKYPKESYKEVPFPIKKIHVKKGTTLTNYGKIEDSLYFINNGIIEVSIKNYMSEKIIDFFF